MEGLPFEAPSYDLAGDDAHAGVFVQVCALTSINHESICASILRKQSLHVPGKRILPVQGMVTVVLS